MGAGATAAVAKNLIGDDDFDEEGAEDGEEGEEEVHAEDDIVLNEAGIPEWEDDVEDAEDEDDEEQEEPEDEDDLKEGMLVGFRDDVEKPKFGWGKANRRDKGILVQVALHKCTVNFPKHKGWKGLIDELEEKDADEFEVGSKVRVMKSIDKPKLGWGKVTHEDVGNVIDVSGDRCRVLFNGARKSPLAVMVAELEVVVDEVPEKPNIQVGNTVVVKPEVKDPKFQWGKVKPGDVGIITQILEDDVIRADFKRQKNWKGCLSEMQLATGAADQVDVDEAKWKEQGFVVGAVVKVKASVETPKYKWGKLKKGETGRIRELDGDDALVDFPSVGKPWRGYLPDLELYKEVKRVEDDLTDDEAEVVELFEDKDNASLAPEVNTWVRPGRGEGLLDLAAGCKTKVKDSVEKPTLNWGKVKRGDVGVVTAVKNGKDGPFCCIDFDHLKGWNCYLKDLERVESPCPAKLFDTICPNDIKQGSLGDCWLLAAFASLAEYPAAVQMVFNRGALSKRGKYTVKLFCLNDKVWKTIVVDDRLPANGTSGLLYAGATAAGEVWVPLLEKACAKLYGTYEKLKGGWGPTGWATLLGCLDCYSMRKTDGSWLRRKILWANNDELRYQAAKWPDGSKGEQKIDSQALMELLQKWDDSRFLMCASGHLASSDTHKVENIVQSHEYSLIQVAKNANGEGVDLVQLRNPWGSCEWQGDWSDKSDKWSQHPGIAKKLQAQCADDGLFWMAAADFFRLFDFVCVMERPMPLTV